MRAVGAGLGDVDGLGLGLGLGDGLGLEIGPQGPNDAVNPPSCQPAEWSTMFAPPSKAPVSEVIVSVAPCASSVFDVLVACERHGTPMCRAN